MFGTLIFCLHFKCSRLWSLGLKRVKVKRCPFSTDLVLDRSEEWSKRVKTRFYVYPVHASSAFVLTPNLASALYLVVLRLLARDYERVSRLIASCATDTAFSDEERWMMKMVGQSMDDSHPDAHAVRLRLSIVCKECEEPVSWDAGKDKDSYFKKYSHVSAACRLTADEERAIGVDAGRLSYLAAVEKAAQTGTDVKLPQPPAQPSVGGAMWIQFMRSKVPSILERMRQMVRVPLKYRRALGASQYAGGMVARWEEVETDLMTGQKNGTGLLHFYELLIGRTAAHVDSETHRLGTEADRKAESDMAAEQKVAVKPTSSAPATYSCAVCTYINQRTVASCAQCETPNPHARAEANVLNDFEEGPRMKGAPSSFTLTKLMIQQQWLKASKFGMLYAPRFIFLCALTFVASFVKC
jgi:hypothetical protein